jgi:hypothetical protein
VQGEGNSRKKGKRMGGVVSFSFFGKVVDLSFHITLSFFLARGILFFLFGREKRGRPFRHPDSSKGERA